MLIQGLWLGTWYSLHADKKVGFVVIEAPPGKSAGGFFVAMKLRTKKGGLQPMLMQEERRSTEAPLQRLGAVGLREAEYELAFFTESAKIYWRMWGPLGQPMLHNIDLWAQMQRDYFQRVREPV